MLYEYYLLVCKMGSGNSISDERVSNFHFILAPVFL